MWCSRGGRCGASCVMKLKIGETVDKRKPIAKPVHAARSSSSHPVSPAPPKRPPAQPDCPTAASSPGTSHLWLCSRWLMLPRFTLRLDKDVGKCDAGEGGRHLSCSCDHMLSLHWQISLRADHVPHPVFSSGPYTGLTNCE